MAENTNAKSSIEGLDSKYYDDVYQELKTDREKIRTCLGMYISKGGTDGGLHLVHEICNNCVDECVNPHSPANTIDVTFIESEREFSITDNGRGIPISELVKATSQMHTSTKFQRTTDWSKGQSGRNGVGMVVVSALTDYASFVTYRGNKSLVVEYKDGELVQHNPTNLKKETNGLSVKFIPSTKYLGKMDITIELVDEYFRQMSYVIPNNVTINLYTKKKADDKFKHQKITYQGLISDVEFMSPSLEFKPIEVSFVSENFDLITAFSYDKTSDEMTIDSYCNYIHTTEGGTHELACQKAICDFLTREAKRLDANSKYEITYDDCRKGLIMAINCRHVNPAFEGQHKSRTSNADVLSEGRKGINEALTNYFSENNGVLRKIIDYLRQIAKIRLEACKIKGISTKKPTTFLDDADLKGFINVSDRNYSGYKEILISEGISSRGAITNARSAKNQAAFIVFGVTDNVFGLSVQQMLQKETFRNLTKILGCGVGADFDINKLKYDRVIIFSDGDTDGDNITSLLLCFFLFFMPGLLIHGKIYKAVPPLYLFNKKSLKRFYNGNEWAYNKREYYELFNTIICSNIEIGLLGDNNEPIEFMRKPDEMHWLEMNSEYLIELKNLAKRSACNLNVLEGICHCLIKANYDILKFQMLIKKEYDELEYNPDFESISGSYNGESISLIMDKLFIKNAKRFMTILEQNPSFNVITRNRKGKENSDQTIMTIGEFLMCMNSQFNIEIDQRFKGLGEIDPELLFTTSINPKQRKLIRMTLHDAEEAAKTFTLLHGKSSDMREERRNLLEGFSISYEDIDN